MNKFRETLKDGWGEDFHNDIQAEGREEGQKKSPNGEVWGQGSFILRRKAENKTAGS